MTWLALLLGCPSPCRDGDPDQLEIGTGEEAFRPVSPGDTVVGIRGGQGGFHYEVALRGGMADGPARIRLEMWQDDFLLGDNQYTDIRLRCNGDDAMVQVADLRMFPLGPYDSADTGLQDTTVTGEVELRVMVRDARGRETEATTIWVLEPPS